MVNDPILRIGEAGLETTDEKVKALMSRMVNAQTPGFKSSDVAIRSFPVELEAAQQKLQSQKPQIDGTFYNHLQGSLIRTGGPTDLALGAEGFFVILGEWGEGYTRDGRFTRDAEGKLVTTVGNYPVLGQSGPIFIPPGSDINISENGEIRIDGQLLDVLRVVNFPNKQELESLNGSIFRDPGNRMLLTEVVAPRIVQGYIEASNVNIVDEMMQLIYLNRIYNLDTKIVSTRDTTLSRAIEMGKVQ